jgi:hypothetical protein
LQSRSWLNNGGTWGFPLVPALNASKRFASQFTRTRKCASPKRTEAYRASLLAFHPQTKILAFQRWLTRACGMCSSPWAFCSVKMGDLKGAQSVDGWPPQHRRIVCKTPYLFAPLGYVFSGGRWGPRPQIPVHFMSFGRCALDYAVIDCKHREDNYVPWLRQWTQTWFLPW